MKKIAATLLALAPAAPAVACDHAPLGLATGYAVAAPQCACPDPAADAFAATSVQTYTAPVVTLAPVVQGYQSATVALPTVAHSYSASAFASGHSYNSFSGLDAFAPGHGHNAFSVAQLRAHRNAELALAQARFGRHSLAAAAARRDAFRNRPFVTDRRNVAVRREGVVTRALRVPGRVLGGLFGR